MSTQPAIRMRSRLPFAVLVILLAVIASACAPGGTGLTGDVAIDGSSTVFPITEAVAEEFRLVEPRVRATIGVSGTGGGFKRFCSGETDISNASRPIKESERETCAKNGIEYTELEVAFDGVSLLVNLENDFVDHLTTDELHRIWEHGSKVTRWNQVRPEWPAERMKLFGPDTESGTFDYFTEAINGAEGAIRFDFTGSTDDNVLVRGVYGERYALGYFGYSYYRENKDKLRLVPIDPGDGDAVFPTEQTITDGSYHPLSRPLFIYINNASVRDTPAARAFVEFYLESAAVLSADVGYVALPAERYEEQLAMLASLAA